MRYATVSLFSLTITRVGTALPVLNDDAILAVIIGWDKRICTLVELINVENKDTWENVTDLSVDSFEDNLSLGSMLRLEVSVVSAATRNAWKLKLRNEEKIIDIFNKVIKLL